MRILLATALLASVLHLPAVAEEQVLFTQQDAWERAAYLADLMAHFPGADALPAIKKLLEQGTDPNAEDSRGNTPLLLLCRSLEMDYRYRTEPHYQEAVDKAVELLLENKADVYHENKRGCSAMFYLQGKPELIKRLEDKKLLPPDLAVKIPHEEMALLRYMRLRVAQAELTTNEASRAYLSRRYCAPVYDRALKILQKYLRAEMRRNIPVSAMQTTLAFLRLANAAEAEKFVNALPVWEHSEHFLEEVPAFFLHNLDALEWNVKPAQLQVALNRLDSMLPRNDTEIIDCNAAPPMCCLLTMLDRQAGDTPPKQLDRFTRSRDNRLAYTALCLQLKRKGLPTPDPESLYAVLHPDQPDTTLTDIQRRIWECSVVDAAIRDADLAALDAGMVRRVRTAMADMGVPKHAALLERVADEEGIAVGEESLTLLSDEYTALQGDSPQVVLARYILNHPAIFPTAPGKQ